MSPGRIRWHAGTPAVQRVIDAWWADPSHARGQILHETAQRTLTRIDDRSEEAGAADDCDSTARRSYVLKVHHLQNGRHPRRESIKKILRYSPAHREWRALVDLTRAGVPVPAPLAWGELPSGDMLVASEYVSGTGLASCLEGSESEERAVWIARLAETVSKLHAAGYRHGDLHLGNLRAAGDRVVLLDLQRTRLARGHREKLRDLAHLDFSIARRGFPASDRRHLREALGAPVDLDAAARRFVRDFLRGRSRRELRIGMRFRRWTRAGSPEAGDPTPGGVLLGMRDSRVARGVVDAVLEQAVARDRTSERRDGRTAIGVHTAAERRWVVKSTSTEVGRANLLARLRRSSARRSFRIGQRLSLLGPLGATPVAALDERLGDRQMISWLVLEEVGRFDLDAYVPNDQEAATGVAIALAEWMAEWQAWGIDHLDLKAGNIRIDDTGASPRFWLVDLGDVRFRRHLPEASRLRALVQLNASLADEHFSLAARHAGLAAYCARLPFEGLEEAQLIESIRSQSLARNHRWRAIDCVSAKTP